MSGGITKPLTLFQAEPKSLETLPALFYFALSGEASLNLPPLNEPIVLLRRHPIHLFSVSLPYHDAIKNPDEAIKAWRETLIQGTDPLLPFIEEVKRILTAFFDAGLIDPKRCAVAGLSRGAYAASRLFAEDPRFTHLLGWAPLIDFSSLSEEAPPIPGSLFENLDSFVGRPLKFLIGNHDTRVHTDTVYTFIRKLTQASIAQGIRSPDIELALKPSIGYKGHGTSPETFKEGTDWLLKQFNLV
jgi:esterase FrsA